MHPVVNAVLWLLHQAHHSGNHPDGEAQKHIDEIQAYYAPNEPAPEVGRFLKLYPCGCTAGPGPADMPDYCPQHGTQEDAYDCQTVLAEENSNAVETQGSKSEDAQGEQPGEVAAVE